MNKMHLIIRQEYLNRVRKRSFIAMTLLMPFLFVALISFPHWMSKINDTETHDIIVLDYTDRKSTRLNSSHVRTSRMPSSA